MEHKELKEKIYSFLEENGEAGTTFPELEDFVYDNFGLERKEFNEDNTQRCLMWKENLIIWVGLNETLEKVLSELSKENKIVYKPTTFLVYVTSGLNLPTAKSLRDYKTPHWIPSIIITEKHKGDAKIMS